MTTLADIEALGYAVGEASSGVYYVSGFGVGVYVDSADQAALDRFADPTAHAERANQFENGRPATLLVAGAPTPVEAIATLNPATATVADIIDAVKTAL